MLLTCCSFRVLVKILPQAALGVVCLAACGPRRTAPSSSAVEAVPAGFDHVIVAIDTFARGVALLRAITGVAPVAMGPNTGPGFGAYPGRGTQSAVLGLGAGRYLELVGPADTRDGVEPSFLAIYRRLTPIGWAVRSENLDSLHTALARQGWRRGRLFADSSRTRLDGHDLSRWRVLEPWSGISTVPPFFVEWNAAGGRHPSADAPAGCTLATVALDYPHADSLRAQVNRAGVRAQVSPAARQAIILTLDCPTGRVRLPAVAP